MSAPKSVDQALQEIERQICSMQVNDVSLSADADGTLSIDIIGLAPRNGGKYRLLLALDPIDPDGALRLYEGSDGKVNAETPPATIDSWFEEGDE